MPGKLISLAALVAVTAVGGCTPKQYAEQADRASYRALAGGQRTALGERRAFEVLYQPYAVQPGQDVIRVGEKVVRLNGGGEPTVLTLEDALRIAFANGRTLQDQKESLYSSALALASSRRSWDYPLLDGDIDAEAERSVDETADPVATNTGTASAGLTLTQRLVNGAVITLAATLDLATDFLGGKSTTYGSLLEANVTQPLLKGAWRQIAYEDQYRLERDFLVDVFTYERFTQTYAVSIIDRYYAVLEQRDQIAVQEANIRQLEGTVKLTGVLVKGGQRSPIELDQARQDLLDAQIGYKQLIQRYEDALDSFKILIGLPIRANVELDYPDALHRLAAADLPPAPFEEDIEQAIAVAMATRPDVLSELADLRDADRNIELAADEFLPQLDITLGYSAANIGSQDFYKPRFDRGTRMANVVFNYPIDQTENRDAYRNALIAFERAQRDAAEFLDNVRLEVRQSFREMIRARQTYELQKENVRIAARRTKLARKQQQAGEASARDVLEAEDAARRAQNGLTSALVSYTTTRLTFLASLGLLRVDDQGQVREAPAPQTFARIEKLYPYLKVEQEPQ